MKTEWTRAKALSLVAATTLVAPMMGCGAGDSGGATARNGANLPAIDDSMDRRAQNFDYRNGRQQQQQQGQNRGMSTGTKLAMLGGAAALYYMYRKNQERRQQGDTSQPQYYLSKNGRVYYRDASGRAHWVTPPKQGIQVPMEEAMAYRDFQGYNGRQDGRTLLDLGENAYDSGMGNNGGMNRGYGSGQNSNRGFGGAMGGY